jgi:hypothetical protein
MHARILNRTALAPVAAGLAVILLARAGMQVHTADASPGAGLCASAPERGTASASFPLATCIGADGIWLRNDLSVPVGLAVSGDAGSPIKVSTNLGIAADVTRGIQQDPLLLIPGDIMKIPIGAGGATVRIANTNGGGVYAMATAFFTYAGGQVKNVTNTLTQLISELAADIGKYRDCIAGANFLIKQACGLVYASDVTFAFGRAVVLGLAKDVLALFLNTAQLLKFLDQQVPDVSRIMHSDRTVTVSAVAPPPITQPNVPTVAQPAPQPNPAEPKPAPQPNPAPAPPLSAQLTEDPYTCDGGSRYMGTISGAVPGETIRFSSPTVSGLASGTADGNGNLRIRWQCQPSEGGQSWQVTATSDSGRQVTFTIHGATPAGAPAPAGTLDIRLDENPFRCDGSSHHLGLLSGAQPGETITFASPTVSGMLSGRASSSGTLNLIWQCQPSEVGQSWEVTASGTSSGRQGKFTVTGG